jgi:hypothetical protein
LDGNSSKLPSHAWISFKRKTIGYKFIAGRLAWINLVIWNKFRIFVLQKGGQYGN